MLMKCCIYTGFENYMALGATACPTTVSKRLSKVGCNCRSSAHLIGELDNRRMFSLYCFVAEVGSCVPTP